MSGEAEQSLPAARPPATAWKAPTGLPQRERKAEQDRAAGGFAEREIRLSGEQRAHASVTLRLPRRGRRIYAYLRWSVAGKTSERYVGEVAHDTREENLAQAWRLARAAGLLAPELIDAPNRVAPNRVAPKQPRASWASSANSRAVMRANRGRDTRPEKALRSAIHALGFRYRVNTRPISSVRRTADIVFTRRKIAVFLDGCFWHGCAEHYRPATGSTSEFWNNKIANNQRRDADTDARLGQAGWEVIRIWEHEDPVEAAHRVTDRVRAKPSGPG